ncbi:MAG: hypothetical protein U0W24_14695 [Bacteroidales bacterium]
MKQLIGLIIILMSISCVAKKNAHKQADLFCNAIIESNYNSMLNYTHPNVIKLVGGENQYINILKLSKIEMQNLGNNYESIKTSKVSKIIKAGNELHCLVPETITMNLENGKNKNVSNSYLLAISDDKGKNWKFIETALLNKNNLKVLVPNYNPKLLIPNFSDK